MKVLFVPPMSYPLHMGGFESQVLHIFNKLKSNGIDVCWYDLVNTDLSEYDIIHFHSSVTEFIPIAMKAKDLGKIIVVTPMIGSPRYSNTSYWIKKIASNLPGFFYVMKKFKLLYSMADAFITLTQFEKNRLNEVFGICNNTFVVPNGIDDSFFIKSDIKVDLPFQQYAIVVGRIEPDKNQLPLIEIANQLNFNLLIVGEPGIGQKEYFDLCKEKAKNNVCFWGKETNPQIMRILYKNAFLTAIPSLTEMLPLVIFESLSQKTPVLCTTHCGFYPQSLEGVFYAKPEKGDLLKKIKEIIPNISKVNIGSQGIYSWDDIAKHHISIYNKLF